MLHLTTEVKDGGTWNIVISCIEVNNESLTFANLFVKSLVLSDMFIQAKMIFYIVVSRAHV